MRYVISLLLSCLISSVVFSVKAEEIVSCKGNLDSRLFSGMADRHITYQFPSDWTAVTPIMNSNDDFSYSCMAKEGRVSIRFLVGSALKGVTQEGLVAEYLKINSGLERRKPSCDVVLLTGAEKTIAIVRSPLSYKAYVILEVPENDSNLWRTISFYSEVQK